MPLISPPTVEVTIPKMPPDGIEKVVVVDDVPSSSATLMSPEATMALVELAGIEIVCPDSVVSWSFKKVASPTCRIPDKDSTCEVSTGFKFKTPKYVATDDPARVCVLKLPVPIVVKDPELVVWTNPTMLCKLVISVKEFLIWTNEILTTVPSIPTR